MPSPWPWRVLTLIFECLPYVGALFMVAAVTINAVARFDSRSWQAAGQYRFNDWLGLEGAYHLSGNFEERSTNEALPGKLELTFDKVSLNDLAQQCVALMQPQANRERIIIRTSLAQMLPPVIADARALRQIALNLIGNSIHLANAGGQVIVSTALSDFGEVMLRFDPGHGRVRNARGFRVWEGGGEYNVARAMRKLRNDVRDERELAANAGIAGCGGLGIR